jgi:4-carboxymuconolactone decarboxylase
LQPVERAEGSLRRYHGRRNQRFGSFVATRQDGALIGPFNPMLHFPAFGRAAWAFNKTIYGHTTLANSVLQVTVLVTGTRLGARYQIYGHEHLAQNARLPRAKIATIVAGERPTDLIRQEVVAYDVAAALNRGAPVPETIYQAGGDAFGEHGMAEIIFLVACFHIGRHHPQWVRRVRPRRRWC